jgi:hypothetical protein
VLAALLAALAVLALAPVLATSGPATAPRGVPVLVLLLPLVLQEALAPGSLKAVSEALLIALLVGCLGPLPKIRH